MAARVAARWGTLLPALVVSRAPHRSSAHILHHSAPYRHAHFDDVVRTLTVWHPPQWYRARPDDEPRGTHTPDGSCGHTANNVIRMNSTGVSSLYIPGIAITRFLIHRNHILHVRHIRRTIRNSGRKSEPLCGPASLVRTASSCCFTSSLSTFVHSMEGTC